MLALFGGVFCQPSIIHGVFIAPVLIIRILHHGRDAANVIVRSSYMSVEIPERDGDGYLLSMADWTPEIGRAMAEADEVELDDAKWEQILKAREYYDDENVVPPIRKFAKYIGQDQKVIFKMWKTGPMKPITKYGGLPKPTGCV